MNDIIKRKLVKPDIVLDLVVGDSGFEFSTSIVDALAQAEIEITEFNETNKLTELELIQ